MATDQEIRDAGILYMPQQKYLQNPYNLSVAPVPPPASEGGGITSTQAFTNSNDNNFNQFGNAFGYGSPVQEVNVRTFNPQELPGAMTPGGQNANTVYNQAFKDLNDPSLKGMSNDFVGKRAQDVMDYANESIMDYRQNYGAGNTFNAAGERTGAGQFESPYDDSMDLGYQGTLGNKGRLNRFKNTIGKAAKFAGGLLPFPLNMATKFLPQGNDNGPGGGTYGIAGLSDEMKGAYNDLSKAGMLFNGQNGFKTLTGKNFQAKNYLEGQLDIYNDKFASMTEEEIAALTGFQKKQYLESSAMYKTTEKERKEKEESDAAADVTYKEKLRKDKLIAAANTKNPDGSTAAYNYAGRDNEFGTHTSTITNKQAQINQDAGRGGQNNDNDPGPSQDTESQTNSQAGGGGFYDYARGGRAGYFFGGRVNYKIGGRVSFKNGGLASIL